MAENSNKFIAFGKPIAEYLQGQKEQNTLAEIRRDMRGLFGKAFLVNFTNRKKIREELKNSYQQWTQ